MWTFELDWLDEASVVWMIESTVLLTESEPVGRGTLEQCCPTFFCPTTRLKS